MHTDTPTRFLALTVVVLFAGLLLPFPESGDWDVQAAGGKESTRFGQKGVPIWDELNGADQGATAAGEPTIGINWNTGNIFFQAHETTYRVDMTEGQDPGRDAATAEWIDLENEYSIINVDPMLHTDPVTGRLWAGGLNGQGSVMGVSDDDGETWSVQYPNNGGSQFDHQSIGSGPWADPKPVQAIGAGEERATYYCAQIPNMKCGVSYDGGTTWIPTAEIPGGCGGLHGHIRVTENGPMQGWAYVPNKKCNGRTGFAVTEDNGQSWEIRTADQSKGDGYFDPSIGLSTESGWLYFGQSERKGAWVGLSKDGGKTWENVGEEHGATNTKWFNVGELVGVKRAMFADMQSGDDLRAAFAFLGSESDAPPDTCGAASSEHVWYYYVAMTYDGGQQWNVQKVSEDPIQMGGIWPNGGGDPCRNLLDFNDLDIDKQGRVYIAFADGCVDCTSDATSRTKQAAILRQRTGCGLYQEFDLDQSDPFCLSNAIPVLSEVGDYVVPVGNHLQFQLSATDANNDEVRFEMTNHNLPENADITLGEEGGIFSWQTALADVGSYVVTFNAYEHLSPSARDMETVTITVLPANDPIAEADVYDVYEDSTTWLAVMENDSDPDSDSIALTDVQLISSQGAELLPGTINLGAETVNKVRYTPVADFNGEDTFTYTIFDGKWGYSQGTVTVNVLPVNDPPEANDDQYTLNPADGDATFYLLDNDDIAPDSNEALFIVATTTPRAGSVSIDESDMFVTYTPATEWLGVDVFEYTVADSSGATATAEVRVRITDRNPDLMADFAFAPATGTIIAQDLDVQFTDFSSDIVEVVAWHWDFGGTTSIQQHPVFAFPAEGDYPVTLTVWGNGGEDMVTKTVTVVDAPPTIDFELLDKQPQSGRTMTFIDRSVDSDGSIVSYMWDFNGDGQTDRTGSSAQWLYDEGGYHEVTLTIVDDADNVVSLTKTFGLGQSVNKEGDPVSYPSGGGGFAPVYQPPVQDDSDGAMAADAQEPVAGDSVQEPASNEAPTQAIQVAEPTTTEPSSNEWSFALAMALLAVAILVFGVVLVRTRKP